MVGGLQLGCGLVMSEILGNSTKIQSTPFFNKFFQFFYVV